MNRHPNVAFHRICLLAAVVALGGASACSSGGGDDSSDSDGDGTGGTTAGGDTSGGDTSGGTTAGGDTSGGDTSGGTTSGGTTAGGDTSGGDTSGGTTSGGTTAGGDTSGGTDGAVPQIVLGNCEALPSSTATFSNDPDAPASFLVGEIVEGTIDPDSFGNTLHYWSIDLPAGFYHVVIDSRTLDGARDNVGLDVAVLNAAGGVDERLIRGNKIDHETREVGFLEVETSGPQRLRVEPNFEAERYEMAVLGNGTPVPAPRFDDCAPEPVVPGTTVSGSLQGRQTPESADKWYALELGAGDYTLSTTVAQQSGTRTNIGYEVTLHGSFGEDPRARRISRVNEIDVTAGAVDPVQITEPATYWLRITNSFDDPIDYELTLAPST